MRIALISLNQYWEDKDSNKIQCLEIFKQSESLDLDLCVFPEMTLTGFSMNPETNSEEFKKSSSIEFFISTAKKYKVGIVFGICLNETVGFTNCAMYIDKFGEIQALYRKIHPFTFADEDQHFSAGSDIVTFIQKNATIGLSICYDLRFPELYRLYTDNCQIIIILDEFEFAGFLGRINNLEFLS